MKYIIILGDGMADEPLAQLDDQTPLAYADTKNLDRLSKLSQIGMVHTIPEGMKPGSDTANLSVLGYDPRIYYSGRSPLEALSIGVKMAEGDVAIRCNVVTLTEDEGGFSAQRILDHSSSEISTKDCAILLKAAADEMRNMQFDFHVGTSYRHCLVWHGGRIFDMTPPHDILGQGIAPYLPVEPIFLEMMEKSYYILKDHPINLQRKKDGLNPANCFWFWGAGSKPSLLSFQEKTGKIGFMVSAVDLLKGIAVGAKMGVANVPGANGGLHTNYEGKVQAAIQALTQDGYDFAYLHVEAPDEMGHQGSIERKVEAIRLLDERVIGPVFTALEANGEPFRLMVLPDHPTPIRTRTHTNAPVPFLLYDSTNPLDRTWSYNEVQATAAGYVVKEGHELIDLLLSETR
ncbi:MAG: cofactor-independent phosphoglycerate mutase [Clostridium sp.]|nr:cofactor-independent phosphoglycerate mutase [Clostridium sp.]